MGRILNLSWCGNESFLLKVFLNAVKMQNVAVILRFFILGYCAIVRIFYDSLMTILICLKNMFNPRIVITIELWFDQIVFSWFWYRKVLTFGSVVLVGD